MISHAANSGGSSSRKEMSGNRTVAIVIVALIHAALGYAIVTREYGATPFLILFGAGYWLVACYSIHHGLARVSWIKRPNVHHVEEIAEAISPEPMRAPVAMSAMSER